MVIAVLAFALGMAADAALTLIAVMQIRRSQTELLAKAASDFEDTIKELADRVIGEAVSKAISNVPGIVKQIQSMDGKK